jgi:hypothetical protein
VFQPKKQCQAISDSDNEGPQQIQYLPPAPNLSNEAKQNASQLQDAAAKKVK